MSMISDLIYLTILMQIEIFVFQFFILEHVSAYFKLPEKSKSNREF